MERDGPSALETTLPFDERQVLEENRPFLEKALEVIAYFKNVFLKKKLSNVIKFFMFIKPSS